MAVQGDVAFETICMLSIGSFLGYFVWGLSSFGAGLVVVCCWSFFTTIGFNAGPIELVIGADSISNILASIPFLIMTESCTYGDYGIFGPIVLFRNITNSFGAYLLHSLDDNLVQLILGPLLLGLILFKYAPFVWRCLTSSEETDAIENIEMKKIDQQEQLNLVENGQAKSDDISQNSSQENEELYAVEEVQQSQQHRVGCLNFGYRITFHLKVIQRLITCRFSVRKLDALSSSQLQRYIQFQVENNQVVVSYSSKWLRSLPVLCLAAVGSGFMGAMAGIPGPPLMYAFNYLGLPKEIVRGNQSVSNALNLRAIFYFIFGSLKWDYWQLYICTTGAAFLGLITGNVLSKTMSTKVYHHVLMGLVFLAAMVLLLRGADVVEN